MQKLIEAYQDRLGDDTTLVTTLGAEVSHDRNPIELENLHGPSVVFRVIPGRDEPGLGGAAYNVVVEVKVWGYGSAMIDTCWDVAERVDQLSLLRLSIAGGGETLRLAGEGGWETIPDPADPDIIHLQARYVTRYWSQKRAAILTA